MTAPEFSSYDPHAYIDEKESFRRTQGIPPHRRAQLSLSRPENLCLQPTHGRRRKKQCRPQPLPLRDPSRCNDFLWPSSSPTTPKNEPRGAYQDCAHANRRACQPATENVRAEPPCPLSLAVGHILCHSSSCTSHPNVLVSHIGRVGASLIIGNLTAGESLRVKPPAVCLDCSGITLKSSFLF